MHRVLVALIVLGVAAAAFGTALILHSPQPGAASFGWTAYAPLSKSITMGSDRYLPVDAIWLYWAPRLGATLLALGAGTSAAASTALLLLRRDRARTTPRSPGAEHDR